MSEKFNFTKPPSKEQTGMILKGGEIQGCIDTSLKESLGDWDEGVMTGIYGRLIKDCQWILEDYFKHSGWTSWDTDTMLQQLEVNGDLLTNIISLYTSLKFPKSFTTLLKEDLKKLSDFDLVAKLRLYRSLYDDGKWDDIPDELQQLQNNNDTFYNLLGILDRNPRLSSVLENLSQVGINLPN